MRETLPSGAVFSLNDGVCGNFFNSLVAAVQKRWAIASVSKGVVVAAGTCKTARQLLSSQDELQKDHM